MRALLCVAVLLAVVGVAEAGTVSAEAVGSKTPTTRTSPSTVTNGDFLITAWPSGPTTVGDGVDEVTSWSFDFTEDDDWSGFLGTGPLASALLTLTLTPGDSNNANDQLNSNGFASINETAIQGLDVGKEATVTFDLLDHWSGVKILEKLDDYSGLFSISYEDDALISYAKLELTTLPLPSAGLLGLGLLGVLLLGRCFRGRTGRGVGVGLLVVVALDTSVANAGTVSVNDDFSGPSLSSDWTVSFEQWGSTNTKDWTYSFSGGALHVTDIEPKLF